MTTRGKVVAWAGVDEVCDCCNMPGKFRWRDNQGNVVAAACEGHRPTVLARLQERAARMRSKAISQ